MTHHDLPASLFAIGLYFMAVQTCDITHSIYCSIPFFLFLTILSCTTYAGFVSVHSFLHILSHSFCTAILCIAYFSFTI
ncbi:hypothetical protein SERLA73DRAFT_188534 [Serpula lacrymans var. lacrymans S7.3]|uniref:Uncharacterized protein n=1 Tax=Serpula lacrymans var. lacrymans (strain S7.3) TaxID=936435 RepID=F8QBH9_SERL3|nr:hypothetical protein SERLA73DRAFT_188534 [Serpula lacrymans var. lacrymans S7.3]